MSALSFGARRGRLPGVFCAQGANGPTKLAEI